MSAEILRRAASLMRERARAALKELPDERWVAGPTIDPENTGWYVSSDLPEADWDTTVAHLPYDYEGDAAPHIASWHPAVALAVADWLDDIARWIAFGDAGGARNIEHALAVARAYLGESS